MSDSEYGEPIPYREHARKTAPPKRKRRVYLSLPGGYTLQRWVMIVTLGEIAWGLYLADLWLWRLLHG